MSHILMDHRYSKW